MDVEGDGRVFPACAMAAGNQVANESAFDADGQARGAAGPANGGQGIGLAQRNFAGVAVQGLPASVAVQGVARRTSTLATRSSSSLMRCDTASSG